MKQSLIATLAACAMFAPAAAPAQHKPEEQARMTVEDGAGHGSYLADADGRALYMFTVDRKGDMADVQAKSNCADACADAWPPLRSTIAPVAGDGADPELLDVIEREGGTRQVTYNGWPLYYFVQDSELGEITSQDKHGFGGEWYLVSPDGEPVEHES